MSSVEIVLAALALSVGYFCLGYIFGARRILYWQIKWIELEHDSARAEGREPRNIECVKKSCSKKKTK